ncbi:MAG: hypothetical protein KAI24_08465 [Planctomycetes bacterium]|nr:hypothetical protein [Planctomycetota bacterium]
MLVCCWLLAASCGYTFGTGLHERGIRTVAFQVVGNQSYRQRFEVEISRYLARELPVTTDLQLATAGDADAVLQVVLTDVRERTAVLGVPDPAQPADFTFPRVREGVLEGAVLLRLVGRDGTVHLERRLLDRTEFRATIGENLTSARAEMAEDMARKIALALESDF